MKSSRIICFCVYILILFQPVSAQYNEWKYSGSFFINTTEEGAFLPESATVEQFPVLVRLSKDFFNFSQAKQYGEDLRFSMKKGEPLAYQIEKWDRDRGIADIWVRVPEIRGIHARKLLSGGVSRMLKVNPAGLQFLIGPMDF